MKEYENYLNNLLKTYDKRIARIDKRAIREKWDAKKTRDIIMPIKNERLLVYRIIVKDPKLLEDEEGKHTFVAPANNYIAEYVEDKDA